MIWLINFILQLFIFSHGKATDKYSQTPINQPPIKWPPPIRWPWEGGGGYPGFQVMGMIKGFFGFEIFNSGIFLGRKIGKYFLCHLIIFK